MSWNTLGVKLNTTPVLNANFGYSVAFNSAGTVAIVGAQGDDKAYIYRYLNGSWNSGTNLNNGTTIYRGEFGWSVGLNGDGTVAIIGAPGATRAYIYKISNNLVDYELAAILPKTGTPGGEFGVSVALNSAGTVAIVGARSINSVYIFRIADNWVTPTIFGPFTGDFGNSVALNSAGTVAIIGAPDASKAYIYTGVSYPNTQTAILSGTGNFGKSVAINSAGTVAIIGAPSASKAYIYTGVSYPNTQTAILSETGPFGDSVAINSSGTVAIIKTLSVNSVYIYTGPTWSNTPVATLLGTGDLGSNVALNGAGTVAILGAQLEDFEGFNNAGQARIFYQNNSWNESLALTQSTGYFGTSLALNSDSTVAIVGAYNDNKAYIYRYSNGSWDTGTNLNTSSYTGNFGGSVAINSAGTVAIVGAPGVNKAYIYRYSNESWDSGTMFSQTTGNFGSSVALNADGKVAIIGAPTDIKAYIYIGPPWSNTAVETLSESTTNFGRSVALNSAGTAAIVGAPGSLVFSQAGAAYIYTGISYPTTLVTPLLGRGTERFGYSVAFNSAGTVAIVGAYVANKAYIYRYLNGSWDSGTNLNTSSYTGSFGTSLALNSDSTVAIVAAYNDNKAYIYRYSNGSWDSGTNLNTSSYTGDFGNSVALNSAGTVAIVGTRIGNAAYMFNFYNQYYEQDDASGNPTNTLNTTLVLQETTITNDTFYRIPSIQNGTIYFLKDYGSGSSTNSLKLQPVSGGQLERLWPSVSYGNPNTCMVLFSANNINYVISASPPTRDGITVAAPNNYIAFTTSSSFTIPSDATNVRVYLYGENGGSYNNATGGYGGYMSGNLNGLAGQSLNIVIAGSGAGNNTANGGNRAAIQYNYGSGFEDIIVAGGGGGGDGTADIDPPDTIGDGGNAGGSRLGILYSGGYYYIGADGGNGVIAGGRGGTNTGGTGAFGRGANGSKGSGGASEGPGISGGGGGGGWYGGGGGANNLYRNYGGGGGSSYYNSTYLTSVDYGVLASGGVKVNSSAVITQPPYYSQAAGTPLVVMTYSTNPANTITTQFTLLQSSATTASLNSTNFSTGTIFIIKNISGITQNILTDLPFIDGPSSGFQILTNHSYIVGQGPSNFFFISVADFTYNNLIFTGSDCGNVLAFTASTGSSDGTLRPGTNIITNQPTNEQAYYTLPSLTEADSGSMIIIKDGGGKASSTYPITIVAPTGYTIENNIRSLNLISPWSAVWLMYNINNIIKFTNIAYNQGLAFDSNGNFYIAGGDVNGVIYQYPLGSSVSNLTISDNDLKNPNGIVFDSSNNMYVASQTTNSFIMKYNSSRTHTESSASYTGADFRGMLLYNNIIYVCINNLHIIKIYNRSLVLQATTYGSSGTPGFADGITTAATFNNVSNITVNPSTEDIYVTDQGNHAIRKINIATGAVTLFAGTRIAGLGVEGFAGDNTSDLLSAKFNTPQGIVYDSITNSLFIADTFNKRVRRIDLTTNMLTTVVESSDNINRITVNSNGSVYYGFYNVSGYVNVFNPRVYSLVNYCTTN